MLLKLIIALIVLVVFLRFLRPYVIGRCPHCGCYKADRSDNYCRDCGKPLR